MVLRSHRGTVVVLALLASLLVLPGPAAAQADDSVSIIKDSEAPSNAEIAARLSEETDFAGAVDRVVISRDDDFADALASGLLQREAPLLLVPSEGPVPDRVMAEIQRLGADDATILGGTGAVAEAVSAQLVGSGLTVERRAGGSRIETAIEIARNDAPTATTAIIARAFPSNPDDPTQGFADALGAGAMAAENGWPILLSDTGALSAATRSYLAESDITRIKLIGGTAALSGEVESAINEMGIATERLAGATRGSTALEIGKELGADSAADVAHVILVDGTGPDAWAGGFAAARRAAELNAPVLLADGVRLLPETEAFLEPGSAFAQAGELTITCVVHPLACTEGRRALGLVDLPILDVDPLPNSFVQAGQVIQLVLGPVGQGAGQPVDVKGNCIDQDLALTTGADGTVDVRLSPGLPSVGSCELQVGYGGAEGITQSFSYNLDPSVSLRAEDGLQVASDVFGYGSVVPDVPLYVNDTITCDGPAGPLLAHGSAYQGQLLHDDFFLETFNATSVPVDALPGDECTITVEVPEGVGRVFWGVYAWSDPSLRRPLLLGDGHTASFSFDDLAMGATDISVVWLLEVHGQIGTPTTTATDITGAVINHAVVPVTCDGTRIPDGYSLQSPGASCSASSNDPNLRLVVIEPGRPIVPADSVSFSPQGTVQPVGVYALGSGSGSGGSSCDTATELPYTFATPGMTTPAQPVAYHAFYAFEGEALRFRADNAFGDFVDGIDPILTVYAPDGSVLATNDDGDTAYNSRIDLQAPSEGTYCLEVSGYGGSTGDYLLTADPAPILADEGEFSPAAPSAGYFYEGGQGDVLIVELRAPGFEVTDPLLEVYGPDGSLIASDDDGGGALNSRIELELPVAGRYQIVATTYQQTSYGPYLIEISALSASAFAAR